MRDIKVGQKDRLTLSSENLEPEEPETGDDGNGDMDIEAEYMDSQQLRRNESVSNSYFDGINYPDFSLSRGTSQVYGSGFGLTSSNEFAAAKQAEDFGFFTNGLMDLEQISPSGESSTAMEEESYLRFGAGLTLNKTGSIVLEEKEAPFPHPEQFFEEAASPANHPSFGHHGLHGLHPREAPSFQPFGKTNLAAMEIFSHNGEPGGRIPEDLDPTPCNCSKSQCLKLYCQCFSKGVPCTRKCQCTDCSNTVQNQDYAKQKRIQKLARKQEHSEKSEIFCSCKMSFCEKSYCVCNKNGLGCNEMCKCFNCKNRQGKKRN